MQGAPTSLRSSRRRRLAVLFSVVAVLALTVSTMGQAVSPFTPSSAASGGLSASPTGSLPSGPVGGAAPPSLAKAAPPEVTVSPTSGPVGTDVSFNATGFTHTATFKIVGSNSTTACSGTTSSTGTFSCTYVIPPTGGGNEVFTATATKGSTTTTNSTTFDVLPQLVANPSSGLVGTPIVFHGTGFGGTIASGKGTAFPVEITWSPVTGTVVTVCETTTSTDGNGSFSCSYVLPAAPAGTHAFLGNSTTLSLKATADFVVIPGLTVGPEFGPDGTQVTLSGTGFGSNALVAVTWSVGPACSNETLVSGSFSCTYTIPMGTVGGSYTFTATGGSYSATTAFVVTYLTVLPVSGTVGTSVTLAGGGFVPGDAVTLSTPASWTGGPLCLGIDASASGGYSCTFTIPATPAGAYLLNATTGPDYATSSLTVEPFLQLNKTYGDPSTEVTFTGSGFGAGLLTTVSWSPNGTASTICSPTTSSVGAFTCTGFKFPSWVKGGAYTITATDTAGHTATATFVVTYLTATPGSAPRGTAVRLAGGGFTPSATVTVTWPLGSVCSSTATSTGTFTCTFADTVYAAAGPNNFTAQDGQDHIATAPFNVTSRVTATPPSGIVGSLLTFGLSGFGRSTLVSVDWSNGTLACSATTNIVGAQNCSLVVPPSPGGAYTLTATDALLHSATTLFNVTASLVLNRTIGVGGTPVTFTGTGFGEDSAVSVSSSLGSACSTTTAANGSFRCTYTIPVAASGNYTFTASDSDSNHATVTFTIEPLLSVSLPSGPVGTFLTFSGDGFAVGATATVSWAPQGVTVTACSATVLAAGTFTCEFTVPDTPTANYTFTAHSSGGDTATVVFDVVPSLAVSPPSGPVGTVVTFTGEGFLASAAVTVTWAFGTACLARTTSSLGAFSCQFTIPGTAVGAQLFTASSAPRDSASVTFTVNSTLTIYPTSGVVGSRITLNGTGLAASSQVTVSWSGGTACVLETASNGSFSCAYVVPATPAGTYTFSAAVSGYTPSTATFTVGPRLTIAPNSGSVGSKVVFQATGFAASASISIVAPTLGTACTGTTAVNGSFSCTYTIPSAPSASYAFTATDARSNQASASLAVGTTLGVSPALGPVGTALRFTGTGFSGSTAFTVSWSGGTVCSGTTGPAGGLSCNTTMPAATLGSHTFTATAGESASTTFTVRPALTAAPASGGAGSSVTFSGTGFPGTTGVTVAWSGVTECNATTVANGSFSCALKIPVSTAGGVYLFTATDTLGDTANASFLVVTGLSVSPSHGPVPAAVTFVGSNFAPDSPVNLTWTYGLVCSPKTNASGGFTCPFTIPSTTPGGTYTFTATDGASDTASVLFTVTFLTASPTGVEVGSTVKLSGGGFVPGAPFAISDPWQVACSGTVGSNGAISCQTTIPANATLGEYNFTAKDSDSDVATAAFGVFAVSTPTASPTSADVGQSVTFSVVASDGTGPLTYTWYGLPSNCTGSGATFSCRPSLKSTGPLSITVKVSDVAGFNFTSPALGFTVYQDPTQAPPTPSSGTADIGQPVTFTAVVSNGSGGGTYAWVSPTALNCTASTTDQLSCRPIAAGSFPVSYNWTDSNGMVATGSTVLTYVVNNDPTQAPPTPSQASADVGQKISFRADVSAGSGGGSYVWAYSSGLNCTASTTSKLTCTPKAVGTFTVSYNWTDSGGIAATGTTTLSYTVLGDPTVGTPTASVASADVGQTVTFSVTATGGAGGFSYKWVGLPSNCSSTASSFSCEPSAAVTSASITVVATDANGFNVTSKALSFTVYSDPTVGTPKANVSSADIGQSVTFSVTASGGSGGLTYDWIGLPTGCSGTGASFSCKPSKAVTNTSITVKVTDSNQFNVTSAVLHFTVYADPTEKAPTASMSSADVGQKVTFKSAVSGGLGPGSYVWTNSSQLNCTASTTSTLSCLANTSGAASVSYVWTDANGLVATGTATLAFTIYVDPVAGVPTTTVSSADVSQTVEFKTVPTGGSGTYTYAWTASSDLFGCTGVDTSATVDCIPTAAGTYTVSVSVTDSNGFTSPTVTSASLSVYPLPAVTAPTATRTAVDVGQSFMFTTTSSGGSGTLTYTWGGSGMTALGCTAADSLTIECTAKSSGTYSVTVTATDPDGGSSGAVTSVSVTVSTAPTLTVPVPSHTGADVGETITYTTTASGGSGGLTYTWSAPSGLNCTLADAAEISCVPNLVGNYTVTVSAVDSNGASTGTMNSANLRVYAKLVVATLTSSPSSTDIGISVTFTAAAGGGLSPFTYTFTAAPTTGLGCPAGKTTPSISCTPTAAGTYEVNVTVTDANGVKSAVDSIPAFTVYAKPVVTLSVSSTSFLQGKSVTFNATVTLGAAPYTYSWAPLPPGCTSSDTAIVTCTPSTAGTYTVVVTVTDAVKGSATANVTVSVQASLFGLPALEGWAIVVGAFLVGLGALVFVLIRYTRKKRAKRQQLQF